MVRQQFFSFAMVVGIGFLLLVSLLASAFLTLLGHFAGQYLPLDLFRAADWVFSLAAITLLFALVFRFVPDLTPPWRRLWPDSFATAVLFTAGKYALGLHLGRASGMSNRRSRPRKRTRTSGVSLEFRQARAGSSPRRSAVRSSGG